MNTKKAVIMTGFLRHITAHLCAYADPWSVICLVYPVHHMRAQPLILFSRHSGFLRRYYPDQLQGLISADLASAPLPLFYHFVFLFFRANSMPVCPNCQAGRQPALKSSSQGTFFHFRSFMHYFSSLASALFWNFSFCTMQRS